MNLGADAIADGVHRRVVAAEQRRRAGGRDLGLVGDHQCQGAQRLLDPRRRAVVDVGEVRHLADQVQVDLGDQMVLRREVGVGGRRRDLGAGGDGAHRQVGIRRLAQHLDAGGEDLAESLFLPPVARCFAGLVCDGDHGIAGHMSKLSDGDHGKQVRARKPQYTPHTYA